MTLTATLLRGMIGTRHAFLGNLADTWVFEPGVGVDYVSLDLDDYTEDSGAGLTYSIEDIESLQFTVDLRVPVACCSTMRAPGHRDSSSAWSPPHGNRRSGMECHRRYRRQRSAAAG